MQTPEYDINQEVHLFTGIKSKIESVTISANCITYLLEDGQEVEESEICDTYDNHLIIIKPIGRNK